MQEIKMTDKQAEDLLLLLKDLIEPIDGMIKDGDSGNVKIQSLDGSSVFFLDYKYSLRKKTFNFRESQYNNYSLVRINLTSNDAFHKNADGERIYGNRINIFSENEYYAKADGELI